MEAISNVPPSSISASHDYEMYLKRKVCNYMGGNLNTFPGAQPISLVRSNMCDIEQSDFFVSEKTDGCRYIMFIHLVDNGKNIKQECYLIDRKNHYHMIPNLYFPRSTSLTAPHSDTLLDGELVLDRMKDSVFPRFLIFDLMVLDGKGLMARPFSKRLGNIDVEIVRPHHQYLKRNRHQAPPPFSVEKKRQQKSYNVQSVFDYIQKLNHGNDGLVFTAVNKPYTLGSCHSMLKWKPPHLNTVDFRILAIDEGKFVTSLTYGGEGGSPRWYLQILKSRGNYCNYAQIFLEKEVELLWCQQPPHHRIAECWWDPEWPGNWRFMRFRDDKNDPNHVTTVPKIMQSIHEGVSQDQLTDASFLERVRLNWKQREGGDMPLSSTNNGNVARQLPPITTMELAPSLDLHNHPSSLSAHLASTSTSESFSQINCNAHNNSVSLSTSSQLQSTTSPLKVDSSGNEGELHASTVDSSSPSKSHVSGGKRLLEDSDETNSHSSKETRKSLADFLHSGN